MLVLRSMQGEWTQFTMMHIKCLEDWEEDQKAMKVWLLLTVCVHTYFYVRRYIRIHIMCT